ncbi:DUF4181 domain-containing protein [Sporosarcina pasteurii]|nr:DUF4181 domain-containing protein [Sporosarcina pasteurii]MDS9472832.1 DUF4181 domain-containing protein [Sporosarcina pasteurii]
MQTLIVLGVIYLVLVLGTDYYLKKTYQIDRKKNTLDKKPRYLQFTLLSIVFVVYIVTAIYMIIVLEEFNTLLIVLPFLLAVTLIRGIFQRIYNRLEKIWILEYNQAVWIVALYLFILFFYPFSFG